MSLFITFEGIEGSGKTTQIHLLADALSRKGFDIIQTREPGGTPVGDQIRQILLHVENRSMTPLCELLLYAASRAQHCEKVIRPALQAGKIVLCDRFSDATVAYQEGGRGLPPNQVVQVIQFATGGLKPHLTFFLDCPVELGLARAHHRISQQTEKEDRFEREEILFHERVRDRYLKIAEEEKDRFLVIDGTGTIAKVHQAILSKLSPFLK
jgi:dTMP kinase